MIIYMTASKLKTHVCTPFDAALHGWVACLELAKAHGVAKRLTSNKLQPPDLLSWDLLPGLAVFDLATTFLRKSYC